MKKLSVLNILVLVSLVLAACSSGATSTTAPSVTEAPTVAEAPTAEPTSMPLTAPTTVMTPTAQVAASPVVTPTVEATTAMTSTTSVTSTSSMTGTAGAYTLYTGTPVAQIPETDLAQKGHLLVCTDFPYPPQEFFDENGNPQGMDIEIGNEIAARLGLKIQYVNSVFDTIIAAVTSGKCDIIISAMNITPDRQKKVSMIPYFQAGQAFVVQKGNPQNINTADDLCGKSIAAESGTTEADYLQGTGTYTSTGGLTQACTKGGKPAITAIVTQKDTDALQQLQTGKVAAYFADSPVAAYYTVQHPDQFQLAGPVLQPAAEGIALPCGKADCTGAALTPLGQAVKTALDSMMSDGTYDKILAKWNLEEGAVKP